MAAIIGHHRGCPSALIGVITFTVILMLEKDNCMGIVPALEPGNVGYEVMLVMR